MAFMSRSPAPLVRAQLTKPHLNPCRKNILGKSHFHVCKRSLYRASTIQSCVAQQKHDPLSPPTLQRYFETFKWREFSINYRVEGPEDGLPVLCIHGFGASINHWRKNIPALVDSGKLRVYAIDLLGFGGSDKASPDVVEYGLPMWKDMICDFIAAKSQTEKWTLVGNSIGSLISLMVASELGEKKIRACSLMNCSGGLIAFRYSELNPIQAALLWLFNTLLFNAYVGPYVFENFRTRSNVENLLKQVYIDQTAVSDELLDILCKPALDDGACQVFLAILNAEAGPAPEGLLLQLTWCPMLVFWGEKDPWTPLRNGFHPGVNFPNYHPGMDLKIIPNAGHCIHDECPEEVNKQLLPFLLSPTLKCDS